MCCPSLMAVKFLDNNDNVPPKSEGEDAAR